MKNFFNNIGSFVGKIVCDASTAASAAWQEVTNGYKAANTTHISSSEEKWFQVVVEKAELKGSVIFITAKDVKTSKTVVMTISTQGQWQQAQLKKLGALLHYMGQCPVESPQLAVEAISQAPEKRLLVLLKGWKSDETLANVVRVQAHDHVAKAEPKAEPVTEPKPKAEPKAKGKGKAKPKAEVKELDESF